MSEAALFISWGQPVHGREKRAGAQMRESIAYCRRLEKEQRIGRVEWASLSRQGGDLWGIGLLHGTPEQLDALRRTEEFARWIVSLTLVCEDVSVIDAAVDERMLEAGMGLYADVVAGFAPGAPAFGSGVQATGEERAAKRVQ